MSRFDIYARYYDLFYKNKPYEEEVDYLRGLAHEYCGKFPASILELGCGTGRHAEYFLKKGCSIEGIDLSEEMIHEANSRDYSGIHTAGGVSAKFLQGDVRNYSSSIKHDVVFSLFHVLNYQNSTDEILDTFNSARRNLKSDGVFIFDSWYGPAVLSDLPEVRERTFEDDRVSIYRKAIPRMDYNHNIVSIDYNFEIHDKTNDAIQEFSETHAMRYLFLPEVEYYLRAAGFELRQTYKWLSRSTPSEKTWYVVFVATPSVF